jgi:hypothetical protein
MSIDTTKWTINNLDPVKVRIEKYTSIDLINLGTTANADNLYIRNSVLSKKKAIAGNFGFTVVSIYPMANIYHAFGLYIDADNRIEFYRKNSGNYKLTFRIISDGSEIYSVDDVTKDFGKYEVRITTNDVISAYFWNGKQWVQIGTNQTADMGEKYIFGAVCGGVISKLSLSYCYIKI